MDEVNACIAANAETEELVDKPEIVKDTVRVAGPFSMEGVIAVEEGPDSPIGGAPEELDTFPEEETADVTVANAEAHLDKIVRLLKASGVDFAGNRNLKFRRLEPTSGVALVHAEGEWLNGSDQSGTVAVSIGPEVGNVTAMQVEEVIRHANRAGYDDVVFAGFGFDAAAQDAIPERIPPEAASAHGADQSRCGDGRSAEDPARQPDLLRFQRSARSRPKSARRRRIRGRGRRHGCLRSGEQRRLPY